MTETELFELLDSWENIELLMLEMSKNPNDFKVLMNIALFDPKQRSWRAAYLADKIHDDFPYLLEPYLPAIIKKLKTENNASKKRHWLKLLSMNTIEEKHFPFLFDFCVDTFTSGNEAVAVRVHAMQILYNISEIESDFKPEVAQIIEHEMQYHPSAGISSRGRKLLKKLHLQIQKLNLP